MSADCRTPRRAAASAVDGWRWAGRVFLVLLLVFTVAADGLDVLTSIKTRFAAMQYPPQWWPAEPTLRELHAAARSRTNSVGQDFLRYFWNSLCVSTLTTILGVVVAVPAAYAFSRFRFPGRDLPVLRGAAAQHVPGRHLPRCRSSS